MAKQPGGFAVPFVIMGGMVLVVVGATISLKALGDQTKTIAAAHKNQSREFAEVGIVSGMAYLVENTEEILPPTLCSPDGTGHAPVSLPSGAGSSVSYGVDPLGERGVLDSTGRYRTSATRLLVEVPITQSDSPDITRFPGLWAESIRGAGRIHANLSKVGHTCADTASLPPLNFLPTPDSAMSLPSGNRNPALSAQAGALVSSGGLPQLPPFQLPTGYNRIRECERGRLSLPRPGDNLALPYVLDRSNCEIRFDGNENFVIYRDGDFTLSGNTLAGAGGSVVWHINGDIDLRGTSGFGAHDSVLLVYGERNITQRGTADIQGFLFAPQSTLKLNGTTKLGGAAWVKEFDGGNSSQGKVYQNISPNILDRLPAETSGLPSQPRIGPIISYREVQVE